MFFRVHHCDIPYFVVNFKSINHLLLYVCFRLVDACASPVTVEKTAETRAMTVSMVTNVFSDASVAMISSAMR